MSNILAVNYYEDFNDTIKNFRNLIIDLYEATNTFLSNFLVENEIKMLHLVDYKKLNEK
jgi:hypothetical protein